MPEKKFVEVRIATAADPAEMLSHLNESGLLGAWEQDGVVRVYWPLERWSAAVLDSVAVAARSIDPRVNASDISIGEIEDRDWNRVAVEALRPMRIGRRIWVRQSWNTSEVPEGAIELIVDPKRAFGTGYHATTQLLVEWLEDRIRGGERVLDLGTGSGILAMTALRLGARFVVALDNDPVAVECARENLALNRIARELLLVVGTAAALKRRLFDLVTANLDRPTLLVEFPMIVEKLNDGGTALLSGMLREDHAEMAEFLDSCGVAAGEVRSREEWIALEVHANEPSAADAERQRG